MTTTTVVADFEKELSNKHQLKALSSVLPKHITVNHFCRLAVMTVQKAPSLLAADRHSLFQALQSCAMDGLLPDGREAVLVEFRRGGGHQKKVVQYMPMVGGILKRARQSGQVASITARCVYDNDEFEYWIDEAGEHLRHVPVFTRGQEPGPLRLVYAMAKLNNGEVVVEPLSLDDINKIRKTSRAGEQGPWSEWFEKMAEKSALHRIARRLPCSSEMLELADRERWLYQHNADVVIDDEPTQSDPASEPAPLVSAASVETNKPTEQQALAMNAVMARIANISSVAALKQLADPVGDLHPDFQDEAIAAVEQKRQQLGLAKTP